MSQKKRKEEIETEFDDDERAGAWAHIILHLRIAANADF
jgi:hypothetical protein